MSTAEHIKYPTTGPPPSAQQSAAVPAPTRKPSLQGAALSGQPTNGVRATSPTGDQGTDAEDPRRAMSPASMRSVQNGSALGNNINNSLKIGRAHV